MSKLVKKLQECSTIGQADPILAKLGAGPAVKKLVETAIILNNSTDAQQRSHAFSFMESAVREIEDNEKLHEEEMGMHSDDDKLHNKKLHEEDDEHKVKEEVLDNHNNGPREDGSEGSTKNTEPFPQVAGTEPDAEGMNTSTGENQWNETGPNGQGMIVPGLPPAGGLSPDIAQEMGVGQQLPPMDTSQMMRQMQYTLKPIYTRMQKQDALISQQREAIKSLSTEIRETKNVNGSMKLDLDHMRKNANATFRETESPINGPMYNGQPMSGLQPQTTRSKDKLERNRSEITEMDKIIRSNSSNIYN